MFGTRDFQAGQVLYILVECTQKKKRLCLHIHWSVSHSKPRLLKSFNLLLSSLPSFRWDKEWGDEVGSNINVLQVLQPLGLNSSINDLGVNLMSALAGSNLMAIVNLQTSVLMLLLKCAPSVWSGCGIQWQNMKTKQITKLNRSIISFWCFYSK